MYSRNTYERRGSITVPPGYDGSRFRRRRRHESDEADEVIIVPDSGFAKGSDDDPRDGELSVGGIPTSKGKQYSTIAEDSIETEPSEPLQPCEEISATDRVNGILEKFGFAGGFTSDELLLLAVIFLIASDSAGNGDVLLILALLLGIR